MNLSCPQCGFSLNTEGGQSAKLSSCSSCSSSLLIEHNSISLSELNVAKNTEKSLFEIGNSISINNTSYTPHGYCHYESQGVSRVEWELSDSDSNIYFLNQEDENLFLVKNIPVIQQELPTWESLQPNTHLRIGEEEWLVVEKNHVDFVSYYGALHNLPLPNTKLKCTYLSNTDGECLVLIHNGNSHDDDTHKAYKGFWLDPMELS